MGTSFPPPSAGDQPPVVATSVPASPAPWWKRKLSVLPVWAWAIVGVVAIGAIGGIAGAGKKDAAVSPASTTVTPEVVATAAPSTTVAEVTTTAAPTTLPVTLPPATAAPVTAPPATEGGVNPFGGDSPEDALMPDVMCMNLQQAQNEIQDHGVFFSRSEDATGQGRMQMVDSNWQVVGQVPEAGTPIGEFEAVLFVVKFGEPSPCG